MSAPWRASCRRCGATVRKPVVPADVCDFCEQHVPSGRFREFTAQWGPMVIHGCAGEDCCAAPLRGAVTP